MYTFHGIRSSAGYVYNGTVWELGEAVAQAHGLWKSEAHKRHRRFKMSLVAPIPELRAIWQLVEGDDEDTPTGVRRGGRTGATPRERSLDRSRPPRPPRAPPAVRATATLRTPGGDDAANVQTARPRSPAPGPPASAFVSVV